MKIVIESHDCSNELENSDLACPPRRLTARVICQLVDLAEGLRPEAWLPARNDIAWHLEKNTDTRYQHSDHVTLTGC